MTSQFQILNKILQTKDFSLVTLNNLTEEHFFQYKAEFNFIKNHYDSFRVVPDRLTFLSTFQDFDITDVNEPDNYLLEQLVKDYNTSYMATGFNKIKKLIEAGKIEEAADYFTHAADGLQQGAALTCTSLIHDTSRYDRYLDRLNNKGNYYLSTGFKELDRMIGGIDLENENMVIAARTGVGKTWTLLKMASTAYQQGKIVGIYSGEMTVDKVGYRFDTLVGHINNQAITRGNDFDPSVPIKYKDHLESLKYNKGDVKVLTPQDIAGPATVSVLRTFIEKHNIEILFVDQYSLLEDTSRAKSTHEKVANISKEIKNLQVLTGIPIISVSQMNRTLNEDGEQDSTQIGLSDRIGQDATSIIMLSRKLTYKDEAKTQVQDDQLILNVVKSRDGGCGKLIYKADFDNGTFIYLDPNLGAQEAQDLEDRYSSELPAELAEDLSALGYDMNPFTGANEGLY
jgi:replicative DNA helicase